MQARRHIRSLLLPFGGTITVALAAATRWYVMSFTDFIAYSSMALIAVGVYLEIEGKEPYKKFIGHFLTLISITGLAYSGGKIAGESFAGLTVSLGPVQFAGFLLGGGMIGLTYWAIFDRYLKGKLENLADAISDFRFEVQKQNINPVLLQFSRLKWRRIAREYHERFGKQGMRLLRRTADPNYKSLLNDVSSPSEFAGFEHATIYLRAAALSLPHYRWHRAFRAALSGALISAAIFFGLLGLSAILRVQVASAPKPTTSNTVVSVPGISVSASMTMIKPGPIPSVVFWTEGKSNREIGAGGRPKTLRFVKPAEATVHTSELPTTIRYANGYLVVKKFTEKGFLVDENGAKGIEVEAEVYR
jgi:hypothetical protein